MAAPNPEQDPVVVEGTQGAQEESTATEQSTRTKVAGRRPTAMTKNDLVELLATRDAELAARDQQISELFQMLADSGIPRQREATVETQGTQQSRSTPRDSATPYIGNDNGDEVVSGSGTRRSDKIPDPPIFHNEPDKDAMRFAVWYRAITNKLEVNADRFANDAAKRAYIESRVGGKAADALEPYVRDTHPNPIRSSARLLAHLQKEYSNPNQLQEATAAFQKLKLSTSPDYAIFRNDFVRLAGELGRSTADWKTEFHTRLTPILQTALAAQYVSPAVDFDEYTSLGANIALIHKTAADDRPTNPAYGGRGGNRNRGTRGGQPGRSGTPRPQGGRGAAPTKLTADDFRKLYDEGRCFVCREKGHLSRECPKAAKAAAPAAAVNSVDPDREARVRALQVRWLTTTSAGPSSNQDRIEESTDSEN